MRSLTVSNCHDLLCQVRLEPNLYNKIHLDPQAELRKTRWSSVDLRSSSALDSLEPVGETGTDCPSLSLQGRGLQTFPKTGTSNVFDQSNVLWLWFPGNGYGFQAQLLSESHHPFLPLPRSTAPEPPSSEDLTCLNIPLHAQLPLSRRCSTLQYTHVQCIVNILHIIIHINAYIVNIIYAPHIL